MLGDDDGGAEPLDRREQQPGRLGIELGHRLVEEQQLRLERERRGQADPLQLAAGELDRLPAPEVERVDRLERALDTGPDFRRRDAEVLEPEGDLVGDDGHHDLVLGILKDRRDRAGELGRACAAGVEPGDDDLTLEAAAVEVRDEPGERAEQRRLARTGRAEESHHLSRLERQRDVAQRRRSRGVREREAVDGD